LQRSYPKDFFFYFENTKNRRGTLTNQNKIYLISSSFAIFKNLKHKKAEFLLRTYPTEYFLNFESTKNRRKAPKSTKQNQIYSISSRFTIFNDLKT
jgi:hypothetical protein